MSNLTITITGSAGAGKTYLAIWLERMLRIIFKAKVTIEDEDGKDSLEKQKALENENIQKNQPSFVERALANQDVVIVTKRTKV
jgi:adenylylsulfate kinase-like enzyme